MRLNVSKIDERIQKLQEIKKLASDPEMLALLQEFIATDPRMTTEPAVRPDSMDRAPADHEPSTGPVETEPKEMEAALESSGGGGIWGIRRR